MNNPVVCFRADGSREMGLGHVIRCCALADMLREVFDCRFFIRNPSQYIGEAVSAAGALLHPMPECADTLADARWLAAVLDGNETVVLDGYHFTTAYQEIIKAKGCKLVCIDDIHEYRFVADAVINHSGAASPKQYDTAAYTRVYTGFAYALLRRSFLEPVLRADHSTKSDFEVLVCLGGADPANDTLGVLRLLEQKAFDFQYHVVIGGAYVHKAELEKYLGQTRLHCNLHEQLNADELAALMQRVGQAVCSPSSVSIEYLSTGGRLYLKKIAANQEEIYSYYLQHRLGFDISDFPQPVAAFDQQLQQSLFDGAQAQRYVALFKELNELAWT